MVLDFTVLSECTKPGKGGFLTISKQLTERVPSMNYLVLNDVYQLA